MINKYFYKLFIDLCMHTHIVTQLDKDLAQIEALRELRTELRTHKEVH